MNLKGQMMVNDFRKHLNTYQEEELQEEIRANVWEVPQSATNALYKSDIKVI